MAARLRLRGAWSAFLDLLNGEKTRKRLHEEVRRRMLRELHLLRADVLEYVASERHGVPNSPLTVLIKGSSKPLVDRGDLRQSVNVRTEVSRTGVTGGCGVLRTARGKGGKPLVNVASALHEGFTIRVTPKVRAAVFAELRRRRGKNVKWRSGVDAGSAGGGAKTWVVRGRPFIRVPFEEAIPRIRLALGDAVALTFKKR